MSKQISIFSAKSLNVPQGYTPYQNCIAYIQKKSSAIPYCGKGQKKRLELMKKVGMKNYAKFYRRRFAWDILEIPTPRAYLEAIGVDIDVLLFTLELDNQLYIDVLNKEREVPYAGVRFGPCIYGNIKTPDEYNKEKDAIDFYNSLMLNPNVDYTNLWIHFPGIIRHSFTRGKGYVGTTYYYPSLEINKSIIKAK